MSKSAADGSPVLFDSSSLIQVDHLVVMARNPTISTSVLTDTQDGTSSLYVKCDYAFIIYVRT